jgi:hypothetical protein
VHNENPDYWQLDLETDWNEDRIARDRMYEEMLAWRNPERIRQGIEAYTRDLPQLLRDQKERFVVAYDGDTRVGIATTREKLLTQLKQRGISKHDSLFIKIVASLEDKRESMSSHFDR